MHAIGYHLVDVVIVVVGFPQLGKRLETLHLNGQDLLVDLLFEGHVLFVPLLEEFDCFLAPIDIGVNLKTIDVTCLELVLPQKIEIGLTVKVHDVGSVGNLIGLTIALIGVTTLEEHRTHDFMLILFGLATGDFHHGDHVE